MAAKKKTKKKAARSKKIARTMTPTKKRAQKRETRKRSAKSASASKTTPARKKTPKKTAGQGIASASDRKTRRIPVRRASAFSRETAGPGSGGQAGDLQGLSNVERADSESVDELIEEGNAFEAGIVSGVEEAGQSGEKEVRTREVPEDDVPEEYRDQD